MILLTHPTKNVQMHRNSHFSSTWLIFIGPHSHLLLDRATPCAASTCPATPVVSSNYSCRLIVVFQRQHVRVKASLVKNDTRASTWKTQQRWSVWTWIMIGILGPTYRDQTGISKRLLQ